MTSITNFPPQNKYSTASLLIDALIAMPHNKKPALPEMDKAGFLIPVITPLGAMDTKKAGFHNPDAENNCR